MLQIARPDGNSFERWKWLHRYFIWTWSPSGVAVCFLRLRLNPAHRDWTLASWFTLSSYLLAIPVALIALYAFGLSLAYRFFPVHRVDALRRMLGALPRQMLIVGCWILASIGVTIIAVCTVAVFRLGVDVFGIAGGILFSFGWCVVVCLCFLLVLRYSRPSVSREPPPEFAALAPKWTESETWISRLLRRLE